MSITKPPAPTPVYATKASVDALTARLNALKIPPDESAAVAALNQQIASLTQRLSDMAAAEVTDDAATHQALQDLHTELAAAEVTIAELKAAQPPPAPVPTPIPDPTPVPVPVPDPTPVPAFVFETPAGAGHDIITAEGAVTVTFDASQLAGPSRVVANVKGNGITIPTMIIGGYGADWFQRRTDLDTPKGGKAWADGHATGIIFLLYDCADPVINPAATGPSSGGGIPDAPPPPPINAAPNYPEIRDVLSSQVTVADMVLIATDETTGVTRTFRGDDPACVNLGRRSFMGKFTHENVMLQLPGYPLVVFFRPDVGGTPRWEFVAENGSRNIQDKTIPADNIKIDLRFVVQGQEKLSAQNQVMIPGQRFRKSSADRPLLAPDIAATLRAARQVPPYKRLDPGQQLPGPQPAATLLGFSWVNSSQVSGGERPDIGLFPEFTSAWLATGDQTALNSMMAGAECAGSFPLAFRDRDTNAAPDFVTNPYWLQRNFYWDQGPDRTSTPLNFFAPGSDPDQPIYNINVAGNHAPALAYASFMCTGDLYDLENLQFASGMQHASSPQNVLGLMNGFPAPTGPSGMGEPRAYGWPIRDFALAELATAYELKNATGSPPLLPPSYWQALLVGYMAPINREYVNNTDVNSPLWPLPRFFAPSEGTTRIVFWEEDYLGNVLCFLSETSISSRAGWAAMRDYKLKSNIARCDPASGWPIRHQTEYQLLVLKDPATGVPAKDWADLARLNNIPQDGIDGDLVNVDGNYMGEQIANLGYGALLGNAACASSLAWLKTKGGFSWSNISWRNSIGP